MLPAWLSEGREGSERAASAFLTVHVQPGAKRFEVVGEYGDALKIRIAAPPVDGKANEALVGFLAERLGLTRAQVSLVGGETARRKRLRVNGLSAGAIVAALLP